MEHLINKKTTLSNYTKDLDDIIENFRERARLLMLSFNHSIDNLAKSIPYRDNGNIEPIEENSP